MALKLKTRGQKLVPSFAIFSCLLLAASPTPAIAAAKQTSYKLIWADEFSGKKGVLPNSKTWEFDLGGLNQNGELQYYTKSNQNVALDGSGKLVITANRIADQSFTATSKDPAIEKMLNACNSCQFSSARLKTAKKLSVQYGRIEARMKVPMGGGTWPAFWMLGTDLIKGIPWPDAGEIDVLETKGTLPNTVFGTVHGPGYSGGSGIGSTYNNFEPLGQTFHTYAIEWKKNQLDFYFDDFNYFSIKPNDSGVGTWVYNQPFFLILNLAMGGEFTGEIDPTINKSQLIVDYIRIYSINGVGKVFNK